MFLAVERWMFFNFLEFVMSDFKSDVEVFSFEERSDVFSLFDFAGCTDNGRYFEPPVNLFDLLRLLNRGLHHSSAVMA